MKRNSINIGVIIIVFVFGFIGIRALMSRENPKREQMVIDREKAVQTIQESLGKSVNIKPDRSICDSGVNSLLVEHENQMYNVWSLNEKVDEPILIGFLFNNDEEIVWAETSERNFYRQNKGLNLDYKGFEYRKSLNYTDGVFAWNYNSLPQAVIGPEHENEDATSIWAFNPEDNSVSCIWYNDHYIEKGQKY